MLNIFNLSKRLLKIRNLWFGLFILKLCLSLLLVLPLYLSCNSVLSSSLYSKSLIAGWDISVIIEMLFDRGEIVPLYLVFIFIGLVIYVAVMQFINGGLYYTVVSGRLDRVTVRDFFAECGLNFNNHMKITLIMIIVYILLIMAGMFFVNMIGIAGGNLIGITALVLVLFKAAVLLLILLAASIFSDSARAAITAYPEKTIKEILSIASNYYRPALFKLVSVFVIMFIPFFIIWFLVEWLALGVIGMAIGIIGIFLEFILFQFASICRTGQKLWYLIFLGNDFRSKNQGRFIPEQVEIDFD